MIGVLWLLGLLGTAAAQTDAPLPAPHQDSILTLMLGSGWVVRLVLLMLVGYSIGCWGIAIAKSREMRRARKQSERFIEIFWDAKNLATIQTASSDLKESPVAQVFRGGYQELQRLMKAKRGNPGGDDEVTEFGGVENVQRAMSRARTQEVTRLERGLTFLATTASTAPFIGMVSAAPMARATFSENGRREMAMTLAPALVASRVRIAPRKPIPMMATV